ncbi:MAG: sulfate transporter CysZ [Aeromonadaceae bacterium]|nr:sulfate transporter CysZ [Aeromonadaceae bacterium]
MKEQQINKNSIQYLLDGWHLIRQPGLRLFVILPLLTNLLLFSGGVYYLFSSLDAMTQSILSKLPEWLAWLSYLIWPLAIISAMLVFFFLFGILANLIAAPFNGLLAEQVEARLTGQPAPDSSVASLLKDIPRIFAREWQKLKYYLPRALLCLLLFWIPVIGQTLAPIIWFALSAWMAVIQYCDYPFDNHKIPFNQMKQSLGQHKWHNMGFGALITCCTMIPVVNFFIMPIAVCGATALWVDRYRELPVSR